MTIFENSILLKKKIIFNNSRFEKITQILKIVKIEAFRYKNILKHN